MTAAAAFAGGVVLAFMVRELFRLRRLVAQNKRLRAALREDLEQTIELRNQLAARLGNGARPQLTIER